MKTIASNRTKAIKAILAAGTRFEGYSPNTQYQASPITREIAASAIADGGKLRDHENGKYSIAICSHTHWIEIFTPAYGSEK